jgi:hypothetical protein
MSAGGKRSSACNGALVRDEHFARRRGRKAWRNTEGGHQGTESSVRERTSAYLIDYARCGAIEERLERFAPNFREALVRIPHYFWTPRRDGATNCDRKRTALRQERERGPYGSA